MIGYVYAFLSGALLMGCACLAAASVGEAQRRGRRPMLRWRRFGLERQIGYGTAFVLLTLILPIGILHDAIARRPWLEWEGPR